MVRAWDMFHNLFLNETNLNNTGANKVVEMEIQWKSQLMIFQILISVGCLLIVCKLAFRCENDLVTVCNEINRRSNQKNYTKIS